jgi:hypothetical protein
LRTLANDLVAEAIQRLRAAMSEQDIAAHLEEE